MMQALHILKKDLRSNRILILFSLLPVIAEIWIAPYQWAIPLPSNGWSPLDILRQVCTLLLILVVICWTILIARVVHAESLIGDRQSWLTRPYSRASLLAAKLLFVLLTISLPLLVLHAIVLAEAGFSPLQWLPHSLINSAAIFVGLLLAFLTIATITSNLLRTILVLLGLLLLLLLNLPLAFLTGIGTDAMPSHLVPVANQVADILFCGGAIVVQYRYRKTALAVALLIADLVVSSVMIPWADLQRIEVNRAYQPISAQEAAGYQFQYDAARALSYSTPPPTTPFDLRVVAIPLHFKNRGPEYGMRLDGMRYTLESADGRHWQSSWKAAWAEPMTIDSNTNNLELKLPASVYSRFAAHPVRIRIQLAISELKAGDARRYTLLKPLKEFAVPGIGYCASQPGFGNYTLALTCRLPFNRAPLTLVQSALFSSPRCSDADRLPNRDAMGWVGSPSAGESAYQLLPVQYPSFPIRADSIVSDANLNERIETNLCPGTPVSFTPYHLVRQFQTTVTVDNYDLQYRPKFSQLVTETQPEN